MDDRPSAFLLLPTVLHCLLIFRAFLSSQLAILFIKAAWRRRAKRWGFLLNDDPNLEVRHLPVAAGDTYFREKPPVVAGTSLCFEYCVV